jgi:Flp pilus assembly protein TadD
VGLVGLGGATIGRKYLTSASKVAQPVHQSPAYDAKVAELLDVGEKALWDGDLETAKESFDRANALAERDPRGLTDLAKLAAVRADIAWLKLRLLPPDQQETIAVAKRELDDAALRAKKIADHTAELLRDDPRAIRAKIDAFRLSGDPVSARQLVANVGSIGSQPETSYVLAALDLGEEAPSWPVVLDRLRTAAAGEHTLLRARAALVYALVRSGDAAAARTELDKVAAASRPHPLLSELKAYVARASGAPPAASAGSGIDAGKRAAPDTAAAPASIPRAAEGEPAVPAGDFRELLRQASQAAASRQYDRAEQLYNAALAKNPGDTEAYSGLGDVARARGDRATARSYYEKVLARNPQYLPAIAALGDIKWEMGDRAGAVALYRELVENSPQSPLARRARERIAQVENPSATRTAPTEAPRAPEKPSPPSGGAPEIDTSDLPGFNR